MIKVIAKMTLQDGKFEEMKTIATKLVTATVKEEGNIAYQLFQDKNNPNIVIFVEEWENEQALKAHTMTEHFKEAIALIKDLLACEKETNICSLVM